MAVGTYETTHEKILESGKQLFLKNGYERTNLRELCKGAGITTGAYYRHFEDKAALFSALVEPAVEGIRKRYDAAGERCFDYISVDNMTDLWNVSVEQWSSLLNLFSATLIRSNFSCIVRTEQNMLTLLTGW